MFSRSRGPLPLACEERCEAAGARQARACRRPGAGPGRVLARVHAGVGRGGAALPRAVLAHPGPGIAADHEPLRRGHPRGPGEWLVAEYLEDDVNKLADVARTERGLQTLHEVTGGDPSGTPRWQANIELGADQELIAALRTRGGEVWGAIGLYREPDEPSVRPGRDRLRPVGLAAARRGRASGAAGRRGHRPEESESPGLVVLDERLSVESTTPGVERWLADLPGGAWERRVLPPAITAVAARALATLDDPSGAAELAVARVRARSGRGWCCTAP
jgi:hypothetical protein